MVVVSVKNKTWFFLSVATHHKQLVALHGGFMVKSNLLVIFQRFFQMFLRFGCYKNGWNHQSFFNGKPRWWFPGKKATTPWLRLEVHQLFHMQILKMVSWKQKKQLTVSWEKNREKTGKKPGKTKKQKPSKGVSSLGSSRFCQVLADPPQHLFGRGGGGWDVAAAPWGTPGLGAQAPLKQGELGSQQEIIIELPQNYLRPIYIHLYPSIMACFQTFWRTFFLGRLVGVPNTWLIWFVHSSSGLFSVVIGVNFSTSWEPPHQAVIQWCSKASNLGTWFYFVRVIFVDFGWIMNLFVIAAETIDFLALNP